MRHIMNFHWRSLWGQRRPRPVRKVPAAREVLNDLPRVWELKGRLISLGSLGSLSKTIRHSSVRGVTSTPSGPGHPVTVPWGQLRRSVHGYLEDTQVNSLKYKHLFSLVSCKPLAAAERVSDVVLRGPSLGGSRAGALWLPRTVFVVTAVGEGRLLLPASSWGQACH